MLQDKNLLVVSSTYNTFVKDQVDIIANHVNKVTVSIRYNPIANVSRFFPLIKTGIPFYLENILNLNDVPPNLNVEISKLFYLPIDLFQYKVGETYFKKLSSKKRLISSSNLIHSHFIYPQGYVGLRLKQEYNLPLVITAHRYDIFLAFKNEKWRKKIAYTLRNADKVICVSPHYEEMIKKLDTRINTTVIPNGFNNKLFSVMDTFSCRKKLGLPLNKKIILNVGYLSKRKGQMDLILAINELVKKRKDVLCVIVGDGDIRYNLEYLIKKNNLSDYVKLVGAKKHEEIPLWMNACDLFAIPSYNEGFAVINVEAFSCGKPVVSTINGGSEYIVTSDDYGYLVNPGDITKLTEMIEIALDKEWNNQAIADYTKNYDWNKIVQQILGIYKELL